MRNNIANYRPISLLPITAHILKIHVFSIMISSLEKSNILFPIQYDFLQGKWTQPFLEYIPDYLYSAFDHNLITSALLDVSKAFDTVSHKILLKKQYSLGFRFHFMFFPKTIFLVALNWRPRLVFRVFGLN